MTYKYCTMELQDGGTCTKLAWKDNKCEVHFIAKCHKNKCTKPPVKQYHVGKGSTLYACNSHLLKKGKKS